MKRVIIIGATSGIGRGIAKQFADNGYLVGIMGRRILLLQEIKKENMERYYIKTLDINDTATVSKQLDELSQDMGGLDILVNCAGIGKSNEHMDFSIDKNIIDTNVLGFTAVADWSYNYFMRSGSGHFVAVTSIAGLRGNRFGSSSYSASKSFQIRYLEGIRHRINKTGLPIFCTDIRPGLVDTDMTKNHTKFWSSSVETAARQIYRGIVKKRRVVYVTKRWFIIAMIIILTPKWIIDKI